MSSRSNGVRYWVLRSDDQIAGDLVPRRLGGLDLLLRDAGVRMLAEAPLDEPRHLEGVLARSREQHEELRRPRCQGDLHRGAR